MTKETKPLETCCYVIGAGAFGIFFRWMQLMLAYNDEGVVDKSSWNVLVPGLIVVSAIVFWSIIQKLRKKLFYVPGDFCSSLKNEGKLYVICRWAFGGLMCIGAALLALQCETDKNAAFLYTLAGCGAAVGISNPLLLSAANRPQIYNKSACAFLAFFPILLFCVWLLTCYKENSINPVTWDYTVEVLALIFSLIGFFRVTGFAYGNPDEWKTLLFCMLGGMSCIMTVSDDRYIGEQIMFGAAALMQTMYVWIILSNMKKGKSPVAKDDLGFEKIN